MGQIEDLRLFAKVVENKSISGAAEALNIAKSAVSRRLALLEERFGAKLINREPGNWNITTTGVELYQRAVSVVSDVDDIEADFKEEMQNIEGPLSISVPDEFGHTLLRKPLLDFAKRHPKIQLSLIFENRIVDLARENFDFAIRITPQLQDNINAKRIGLVKHQLYASRAYLDKHGTPKTIEELRDHPLLNYGMTKRAEWPFLDDKGKPISIEFQPFMNSNSGVFLVEATLANNGIVRLPDFVGAYHARTGELIEVLPDINRKKLGIYLVHAENRRLNRRMRLFAEEITAACLPIN